VKVFLVQEGKTSLPVIKDMFQKNISPEYNSENFGTPAYCYYRECPSSMSFFIRRVSKIGSVVVVRCKEGCFLQVFLRLASETS
jgi:hypothetical protein